MRYCAFCANEVPDEVESCPFCGKRIPKPSAAGATKREAEGKATTGDQAHGVPITYPLPAAGEGATVRGFAPVLPPPPKTPDHHISQQQMPAGGPPLSAPTNALVATDSVNGEVTTAFGTQPAAPIVAPAITMPIAPEDTGLVAHSQPHAAPTPTTSPATAEDSDREQAALDSGVAPMPPAPLGLIGTIPYVFAVRSARRLRATTIRGLDAQIEGEKQKIHETLRDLGQAARRSTNQPSIAREEIDHLIALEEQRGQAEVAKVALDTQLTAEENRFAQSEKGHRSTAEAHRAELTAAQGDLNQVEEEIARHRQELRALEQERASLEKERNNAESRAKKATDMAEKEVLIRSAAEKDVALDDVAQKTQTAEAALAGVSAPQAALQQRVLSARTGLEQAQEAIAGASKELESRRKIIDEERRHGGMQVTQLEREIMHLQVVVGGVLDTHRPASNEGGFEEYYGQIDAHHRHIDEKMRQISALDAEGNAFDLPAHKRGLIMLGSMGGLLALIVLVLVLLLQ